MPVLGVLREVLIDLRMTGSGDGLVFAGAHADHFDASTFAASPFGLGGRPDWTRSACTSAGTRPHR